MATTNTTHRVVVGIDFSELSTRALDQAFATASLWPPAEVHLVAVVEDLHSDLITRTDRPATLVEATDEVRDRLAEVGQARLAHFRTQGRAHDAFPVIAHLRVGPPAQQIANLAAEVGADLVILGTHGRRGVQRMMAGSVAERTVRLAPCPVLVVRPKDTHALDLVPKLDPACPRCLERREQSAGAAWWCEEHEATPESMNAFAQSRRLDAPHIPYGG